MKIRYNLIKFVALMLIILVSSCAQTQSVEPDNITGKFKSKLLLNVTHSATKTAITEDDVQRLDVLLFKDGKLEKLIRNITSFSTTEDGFSSVEIGVDTEGTRKAYLVANIDNQTWLDSLSIGSTSVEELTKYQTANLTGMANLPLLMWGVSSDVNFSTSRSTVLCPLNRVASGIDVENKASNFTLTSARLINSKVASTIFPNSTISHSTVANFEAISANGSNQIRLYSYPNEVTDAERATKVEITGTVNGVPITYTVNLEQNGKIIPVERNFLYTIHINDVKPNGIDVTTTVSKWKFDNEIENDSQPGDAVLAFKIDRQFGTRASAGDETAINYLYAFISYMAADGKTSKFEKITEGENLNTISHTLSAGSYLQNSLAILYVLANTSRTLGDISTQSELESALESKKACVIGDDGAIVIEQGLVAASRINLTLKPGSATAEDDKDNVLSLKRLSGRVYVASSTGKQEDIAGYRIKLENISSSVNYFTYEGSGSSTFGEYVITGNADGQYSVNGKETESIGYFYPSTNAKVTVSHPKIPNKSIAQYINIKPNANSAITITPYVYNPNYPKEVIDAGLEIHTVFNSGTESNSVRIPCLVTARDGSLLAFCETRYNTWKDQSYTDIAVKRSTDNGKTWSSTINITSPINGGPYAFMDPTAVVDAKYTGRVFMFCVRRTVGFGSDITLNVNYMFTSEDNGATWDSGKVVTNDVVGAGFYGGGSGPASGIQLKKGASAGRMIFPMRQSDGTGGSINAAIYSDDGGSTWGILYSRLNAGEAQIAEVAENQLYFNVRRGDDRYFSRSTNSGATWTGRQLDPNLPSFVSGCQASVLGNADNVLLYCGPKGGDKGEKNDNRFELTLYRSFDGGASWQNTQLLYNLASGYSDMTILNDGRLAIAFECGPEKGFIYATVRPAGWMQVQMLILPKEVFSKDYWFDKK